MFSRRFLKAALAALCLTAASAEASVIVTLKDDGTGATSFTMMGTYDVSGGDIRGPGFADVDVFGSNVLLDALLWSIHGVTGFSNGLTFGATLNAGQALFSSTASDFSASPSQLTASNFFIDFRGTNSIARIIGFGGATTGTLNESGTYASVAFSNFNTGIWEFGDPSTPNQGIRLEIGQTAVAPIPLPATLPLLLVGVAAVGAAARRRKRRA